MAGWKPEAVNPSCSISLPFSSTSPKKRQETAKQQAWIPSKQQAIAGWSTASSSLQKILKPSTIFMPFQHLKHAWAYDPLGGFKLGPVPPR